MSRSNVRKQYIFQSNSNHVRLQDGYLATTTVWNNPEMEHVDKTQPFSILKYLRLRKVV